MTDPAQYDPEAEVPLLSLDILATGESMGFLYGGPDYQQFQMLRLADRAKTLEGALAAKQNIIKGIWRTVNDHLDAESALGRSPRRVSSHTEGEQHDPQN